MPKKGMRDVNLGTGITLQQYRDEIEPYLNRPLTLGGLKKRPRKFDSEIKALLPNQFEVRPKR